MADCFTKHIRIYLFKMNRWIDSNRESDALPPALPSQDATYPLLVSSVVCSRFCFGSYLALYIANDNPCRRFFKLTNGPHDLHTMVRLRVIGLVFYCCRRSLRNTLMADVLLYRAAGEPKNTSLKNFANFSRTIEK